MKTSISVLSSALDQARNWQEIALCYKDLYEKQAKLVDRLLDQISEHKQALIDMQMHRARANVSPEELEMLQ